MLWPEAERLLEGVGRGIAWLALLALTGLMLAAAGGALALVVVAWRWVSQVIGG